MTDMSKNLESDSEDDVRSGSAPGSESGSQSDSGSNSDSDSSSSSSDGSDSDSNSSSNSGSGNSSESEAESNDEKSHQEPSLNSSHCSVSSSNERNNIKYWEENPDMYGVRRSGRERKQPERINLVEQKSKTKSKKSSRSWQSSDESQSDESNSDSSSYQVKVKKKPAPQWKDKNSYGASEDSSCRLRASRSAGKVSYKEDSDSPVESDQDKKRVTYEITEDSSGVQTIDKVIKHRYGKKGAVGQQTYIYEVEKNGDPNSDFDSNDPDQIELQFLVKWKGWAHLHNTWESNESINTQKVKGTKKLENYTAKEEHMQLLRASCPIEEIEYMAIQNEMEQELFASHIDAERIFAEAVENETKYYYVKWQNLPYVEATWETENLVIERFPKQLTAFQTREKSPCYPKPVSVLKHRPKFHEVKEQPDYIGRDESFELRDYQLDGLNWLIHAWANQNSVILADEMGLGKTIQAISFLNYLFHAHDLYGPFLVVLPLSTVNAWLTEFAQWAPNMNVIVYIGDRASRQIIHDYEWMSQGSRRVKFNVVLTTYEILLRDKEILQDLCEWSVLIVDEAHRLKNEDSQLYQSLVYFKSNYRLLITGTPLQNSLKELWALLHFIMPSKFNNCEYFESHNKDKEHMKKGIHRLHKQLEPFILRRVKKEVEKSLPAKVEQILRVDMTQCQKRYYKYILTRNYDQLKKGDNGSVSSFINIVMELKKCCNHSTLIREEEGPQYQEHIQKLIRGSGKLLLLDKLLVRLHETGHRVLIFSQMVRMLDILAYYMQLRRFTFQRLDGSIPADVRRQALDHFNAEGSHDFCFLLSTRAGGLGINLATADTVIIFDSDWNPQNDLQAQARAHRIGQKKQVNIYRLVTKNSIEETIIERAKQKMVLDHLVIQSMDTSGKTIFAENLRTSTTMFSREELNAILKFGAEELFKEDLENEEEPLCDIDEILRRAETRDEGPSSNGDDLLSAFKVASFNLEEESQNPGGRDWDDIIPEGVRSEVKEEERQKEMAKLYLPPRKRKTVNDKALTRERNRRRRGSDASNDDSDQDRPRRRGRPRMHHKETVKGFTDAEVRQFFKSFKKFSNPLRRLDTIANDASLRDKSIDDLKRLAEIIVERCKETMRDYELQKASGNHDETVNGGTKQRRDRGPSFKLSSVAINARTMLTTLDELEPLDYIVPHPPVERASWVLQLKRVKDAHWDIPWGIVEDSRLLRGIYEFGMGSWEQIKWDPSLNLADKILLDGELKPQAKHLDNRAQYLLKLLKKTKYANISKQKPTRTRARRGKEPKSISKEIVEDDDSSDAAPSTCPVVCPKSAPKDEAIKAESDKSQTKEESGHSERKRKKPKKKRKSEDKANGRFDKSHPRWSECKEKMRPMKSSLLSLNSLEDITQEDQVKYCKKDICGIGDHIEKVLQQYSSRYDEHSEWKLLLWKFVAQFCEYGPKELHQLYKQFKTEKQKKKESRKSREEHSRSDSRDGRRHKRKHEDDTRHSSSKRPRNGCSTDSRSKERDLHYEDRNASRRDRERPAGDSSGGHNYKSDRHSSASRDNNKESRYPQDFKREGGSGSSSGYQRDASYPQHSGESSYSKQGYYRGGRSDWRNQRPHHQSYSQPSYPAQSSGYTQQPGFRSQQHAPRSNYHNYGSSQRSYDGRDPPPSFQT